MSVVPFATPVTVPVEFTVAVAVELLLQVPPETPSVSVVVAPIHNVDDPVMVPADGAANTATEYVV